jgi:hypothetical protein
LLRSQRSSTLAGGNGETDDVPEHDHEHQEELALYE